MTRINTNVSSLVAQKTLARTNADLQTAMTRLSTGLRINTGKDDPAGLIASEALRSDIVSTEKAISNSERANQVIATADSALGQVSSLLNDIRGLVTEAANTGALSPDQLAANQLQVDASLQAIDRISQTTSFQGRKLLDGSLDFIVSNGTNLDTTKDIQINAANLGTAGAIDVSVEITAAATRAELSNDIAAAAGGTPATATLTLANETVAGQTSNFLINLSGGGQLNIIGANNEDLLISQVVLQDAGVGNPIATDYNDVSGVLTIDFDVAAPVAMSAIAAALQANEAEFGTVSGTGSVAAITETAAINEYQTGVADTTVAESIELTTIGGSADTRSITITEATGQGATPGVAFDTNGTDVIVTVDDTATTALTDIAYALNTFFTNNSVGIQTSVGAATGDGNFDPAAQAVDVTDSLSGGVAGAGGGIEEDVVFEVAGKLGSEVFDFDQGTELSKVVEAINLVSDATGVTAAVNVGGGAGGADQLVFSSSDYGDDAFVEIEVLSESGTAPFRTGFSNTFRATGTDVDATVNGIGATGSGNTISLNTSTLDLSLTVNDGSGTDVSFRIGGGGALFQIGPDVVTTQQVRIGIQSVNTAQLQGTSGRLFELGTGEAAALETDATTAFQIVDQVATKVTSLRGRLGAFQKTTLEANIFTLNETVASLTDAESAIRDADFAAETARLTRAQILVQSGISVLSIANSNPQNVLALLR